MSAVGLWSGAWNDGKMWHATAPWNTAKINILHLFFFFADDVVLKADSEKRLTLQKHSKNFGVEISTRKIWDVGIFRTKPSKMWNHRGKTKTLQKLNDSKYLGTYISYKYEKKYILKKHFFPQNTGNFKQQFYTNFGPDMIQNRLYGGEIWTFRQTDKSDWHHSTWKFSE